MAREIRIPDRPPCRLYLITPPAVTDLEAFAAMLEDEGVRLPGGRRFAAEARSEAEGMEISTTTLEMLEGLAGRKL